MTWCEISAEIARLREASDPPRCCIGFDGYVDTLYHTVRSRDAAGSYTQYETIPDFAAHIASRSGRSSDTELIQISRRMGGNAPIMAEALAKLGLPTCCIGAMGLPEADAVFARAHFARRTIADCAQTIAFEFHDGKLMFGDVASLQNIRWESLKERIGLEELRRLYREASLWGVVNWSFLPHSNDLIEGFLREVVSCFPLEETRQKRLFFDLSDPSGRGRGELLALCSLLGRLSEKTQVVLGLNENEAHGLADACHIRTMDGETERLAGQLRHAVPVSFLAIHGLSCAVGATERGTFRAEGKFIAKPRLSTGGGDNFNAGLCTALLYGLPPRAALAFGNLVASYYVTFGESPAPSELRNYTAQSCETA